MSDKMFEFFGFTDYKPTILIKLLSFFGGVNKGKSIAIIFSENGQAIYSCNITKGVAENFARAILRLCEE